MSNFKPSLIRAGVSLRRTPKTRKLPVRFNVGGGGRTGISAGPNVESMELQSDGWPSEQRAIMFHELLHAKFSPPLTPALIAKHGPMGEFCVQAIEDAYVMGPYMTKVNPSINQIRDLSTCMLRELRTLKANKDLVNSDPQMWNRAMYSSLRVMSGLYCQYGNILLKGGHLMEKMGMLIDTIGRPAFKVLLSVLNFVGMNNRTEAITLFRDLLRADPEEVPPSEQYGPADKKNDNAQRTVDGGAAADVKARIEFKSLDLICASQPKCANLTSANSGAVMRAGRLSHAIVNNTSRGLFVRRLPVPNAGTVMIDASGSMQPTAESLNVLCKVAPGARVMFYNGDGSGNNTRGVITTYGDNGRRAASVPPESIRYGGNAIDYEAIEHMLSFPGPYFLVTDLGFCGGVEGNQAKAMAVLARRPDIKVLDSIEDATKEFSK